MQAAARPKLTVMAGLIGSGKTTAARRLKALHPEAWLIGRDDLRTCLFGGTELIPDQETKITHTMLAIARLALSSGHDIIVDDLNLFSEERARWDELAEEFGAEIAWRVMTTDLAECVRRDSQRPAPVGENAITEYARAAAIGE